MLNPIAKYYRKNNIVFDAATDLPVVSFIQSFPDLINLSETCILYLNRYMEMFPSLCSSDFSINNNETEIQLSLF